MVRVDVPFLVGGVIIAAAITVESSAYFLSFVVLLIAVQVTFRFFLRGRSMRTIGVSSSVIEALALLLLLLRFYLIL